MSKQRHGRACRWASAWLAIIASAGCSPVMDTAENVWNPAGQAGVGGTPDTAGGPPPPVAGMGGAVITGSAGMTVVPSPMAGSSAAGTISLPAAGMDGAAGSVAGAAGAAGMAGMLATAGQGGSAPVTHMDLGQGDGQDVITIGDSWMNLLLTGIEQSLERTSGRDYRNYAFPGTLVLNEQIPSQYASAVAADPDIKTIVMTGGGNDILTSPCTGTECYPIVDDVSERLTMLMAEAGADGVEDIVLIGYTYPADMGKHASLDYSIMLSKQMCRTDMMPRCHFIDSTTLALTLQDGIHPNAAGYDLIGETVWALMQAQGVRR